jgi:hypothetical protein
LWFGGISVVTVAKNFKDAFNKLGLELLTKEDFSSYYVMRKDSPVSELKGRILIDDASSKFLFSGLRASGKTTELRRLMFELENDYFVVYFSAMKELSLVDIDYKDVLLSMVLQTLRTIEEQKVKLSEDIVEDMYDLLGQLSGEVVVSRVETKTRSSGLAAKLSALVMEIGGKYSSEVETRKEIRTQTEHLIQDVIQRFNLLIVETQQKIGKPLLIIVDDLEKADLSLAEEIFYKHSYTLVQPSCKVVFTVPISLVYAPCWKQVEMNFITPPYVLPLKSVKTRKGNVDEAGVDFLKKIVFNRVSSDLFEDEALTKLALWSGGVVVDFLRMVRDCCVKAQLRNLKKIDSDLALEAFNSLVDDYWRPLDEKYYPKLVEVYEKKDFKNVKNDEDLRFLLYLLAVLEYDGKRWYDVHPCVERILFEKGLIKNKLRVDVR